VLQQDLTETIMGIFSCPVTTQAVGFSAELEVRKNIGGTRFCKLYRMRRFQASALVRCNVESFGERAEIVFPPRLRAGTLTCHGAGRGEIFADSVG
jgi:hypothetical protein